MKARLCFGILLLIGGASTVVGQPFAARSATVEVDYAGSSGLSRGLANVGDFSASRMSLAADWLASERGSWKLGTSYRLQSFYSDGSAPLPSRVHAASLTATMVERRDRWTLIGRVAPGIYSDLEDLDLGDFNIPAVVTAAYAWSPKLDLLLGLRFDARNEIPVVGGPGLRWKPADEWTLNLFFPRPELVWRFRKDLSFRLGGAFVGGSYRVGERFGSDRGEPQLNDTQLTYREIRAVAGCTWQIDRSSSVQLDAGAVVNRRLSFNDRKLQFGGGVAPFVSLAWTLRF